jgi:para-aminobenzoate synthetase component 1
MNEFYASGKPFLFVIDYKKTSGICLMENEIPEEYIKFSIQSKSNNDFPSFKIQFDFDKIKYTDYLAKFEKVKHNINLGNSYLCNLTQPSSININLTLEDIYHYSKAAYKLYIKDSFVVFSPETFIEINNGKIFTYPMKGTISAEKEENKEILLQDEKEDAEHNTIVDLLRNDLSIVANQVRVEQFKFLQKIETNRGSIWQMSSKISGNLKSEYVNHPGNLFDRILPAGSVTGAPKEKTVEILDEIENYERGFYTGVFGYSDGKTIHSAVMIRFVEQTQDGLIYKSGGGITSLSKPEQEYQELIQKIYVPVF